MDEDRFNHLVAFTRVWLSSSAEIYRELARHYLCKRRRLPNYLADWVEDVLDGKVRSPAERPRPPEDAARRRHAVQMLIWHFSVNLNLKPSRSLNSLPNCCAEGGSACDVVGAAAGSPTRKPRGFGPNESWIRCHPTTPETARPTRESRGGSESSASSGKINRRMHLWTTVCSAAGKSSVQRHCT